MKWTKQKQTKNGSLVYKRYRGQTDRQTDRQTDTRTAHKGEKVQNQKAVARKKTAKEIFDFFSVNCNCKTTWL